MYSRFRFSNFFQKELQSNFHKSTLGTFWLKPTQNSKHKQRNIYPQIKTFLHIYISSSKKKIKNEKSEFIKHELLKKFK